MSNRRKINGQQILPVPNDDRPGADKVVGFDCPGPGDINGYRCDACKKYIFVIHVDKGVTPMFLTCKVSEDCGGRSVSLMYPKAEMPANLQKKIQWEWYRPTQREFDKMDPGMKDHISRGGLALRRR